MRTWWLTIAVFGMLTLAACGGPSPTSSNAVIAWEPLPPAPTTTSTTTTIPPLAPAPSCRADQLEASQGKGGVAAGNLETTVVLTNTRSTCKLSGYPTLSGLSSNGVEVALNAQHGGMFNFTRPADLRRRQQGELLLNTADACPLAQAQDAGTSPASATSYDPLSIVLPDGNGSVVAAGVGVNTACGLWESQLGVVPPEYPPGNPQTLVASIKLPSTVRSGTLLDYTIALHNPTSTPVALRQCPNYSEPLDMLKKNYGFGRWFQLNCSSARPILPGQTRVFAMELRVPKVGIATMALVSWFFAGSGPVVTGGQVQVLP